MAWIGSTTNGSHPLGAAMEGIFQGWQAKAYGFIKVADAEREFFLHRSQVIGDPDLLFRGVRLQFEPKPSGERPGEQQAVKVQAQEEIKSESAVAEVISWVPITDKNGRPQGHGFVSIKDRESSVFVPGWALTGVKRTFLKPGERVEVTILRCKKLSGINQVNSLVGWVSPNEPLYAFADMGDPHVWLNALANLAELEDWRYPSKKARVHPVLQNYIEHTFHRLKKMDKSDEGSAIGLSGGRQFAAFNTGLLSRDSEQDILALFQRNPERGRQEWAWMAFILQEGLTAKDFKRPFPCLARYWNSLNDLHFNQEWEIKRWEQHITVHNLDRFPKHLQTLIPEELTSRVNSAIDRVQKRARRNPRIPVPSYYRKEGGKGELTLLLPLVLDPTQGEESDLALVIAPLKDDDGEEVPGFYFAPTILTLDMAYQNARLLMRPESPWLERERAEASTTTIKA